MFGFLLKKNFCDGWDNLFSLVIYNVLALFTGIGFFFLFKIVSNYDVLIYVVFLLMCIIFSIYAFAYGELAAKIADFNGINILDFFKVIPSVLKDAVLFGLMCGAIILVSFVSFDYYIIQLKSLFGFFIGAMILWIDIFLLFAFMWFIPIRSSMHNNFRKCLRKCFIITCDNTGFTLLMGLYNLVLVALSVVFIGFFPGLTGILIANANALRLRLYKYDYLEEHPELTTRKQRKQIPWEELIYDDRETLGPRKLKSFIMPWKDE